VLGACNRVQDPCSKRAFADWWTTTAAQCFIKISAAVLDHCQFRDVKNTPLCDASPREGAGFQLG
jgi:hypothetical protein